MTGFTALLKKEIKEQWRTHRFLIIGVIFTFFGIGTPLLMKFLPEILKLSNETMQIEIPTPTAVQTFTEFSGNFSQIGVIVAVLVGMGLVANELKNGTAVITLSKPVSRAAFVTSKFVAVSLTFLASLTIAALFCFFYTNGLIESVHGLAFLEMNLLLGLFLVFAMAVTVLFSCMFKSSLSAGGVAIAVILALSLMANLPGIGVYLPGNLIAWGSSIVSGAGESSWPALAVTATSTIMAIYIGQYLLKRKEI
jgi:ABC-2 type transport system permease protein